MNDSRLQDALLLVSRLEEQGGDIRFLFRKDPEVHREIYTYLDDLTWLSNRPLIQPEDEPEARTKDTLMSFVRDERSQRQRAHGMLPRVAGAAVTLGLLLGGVLSTQVATGSVPGPVTQAFNDVRNSFSQSQAEASTLHLDGATGSDSAHVSN